MWKNDILYGPYNSLATAYTATTSLFPADKKQNQDYSVYVNLDPFFNEYGDKVLNGVSEQDFNYAHIYNSIRAQKAKNAEIIIYSISLINAQSMYNQSTQLVIDGVDNANLLQSVKRYTKM